MMHLGHTMFRDPKVNKTDSDRKNTWNVRLNSCSFRLKKSSARGCRYRLSHTLLRMKLFQQHLIRFGFESQLKDGQNSGERSGEFRRTKWVLKGSRGGGVSQRAWEGWSSWRGLDQKGEGRFGHSSHGFRKNVDKNITNYGVSVYGVWQR